MNMTPTCTCASPKDIINSTKGDFHGGLDGCGLPLSKEVKCCCGEQECMGGAEVEIGGVCHRPNNPCYQMTEVMGKIQIPHGVGNARELLEKEGLIAPNTEASWEEEFDREIYLADNDGGRDMEETQKAKSFIRSLLIKEKNKAREEERARFIDIGFEEISKARKITQKDVGMLRQWLNEDRITEPKKMVTNEDLIYWIEAARGGKDL